ncbi:hypothetical protein MW887_006469 [Aspergillus wentii]|nr:hypothetical protein MW887_006469 [Aspergillus wentii]
MKLFSRKEKQPETAPKPSIQNLLYTTTTTTYQIYHEGVKEHILISPVHVPRRKSRSVIHQIASPHSAKDTYFIHVPFLAFHNPARTLRRGGSKSCEPICLINDDWFWKRWNIQFGDDIGKALDRRGVVRWENRSNRDNSLDDDCALKGYKVRSWRAWYESGKYYHRDVNEKRKRRNLNKSEDEKRKEDEEEHIPMRAEQAVNLSWESPFSVNTRCYQFRFGNIDFAWKGTSDVPADKKLRDWLPLTHLKLVAMVPVVPAYDAKPSEVEGHQETREVLLAQYTSSFGSQQYGSLITFDSEISKLLHEFGLDRTAHTKQDPWACQSGDLHLTRFYDVIIATGMCMIMGEWEKRQTVFAVILLALAACQMSSNG